MLLPPQLPPAHRPTVHAVEVRLCDPRDVKCPWETANDVGEGMARIVLRSASTLSSASSITGVGAVSLGGLSAAGSGVVS
jgi:hypothetical protein